MLPSMGSEYATGDPNAVGGVGMGAGGLGGGDGRGRRKKRGLVRAGMDWVWGLFGGFGEGVGWRGDKRSF